MIIVGHAEAVASSSTLPAPIGDARTRRAQTLRRAALLLLAGFVLAGATGLLGTRTATATGSGGDHTLTVTYPSVSRSGHAVKVEIEIRRQGGFTQDEPIRLRLLSSYFDLFDENSFSPQPDSETADATYTYDEFSPPDGDTLLVSVDTRIEPARNRGGRGEAAVLDRDGATVVVVGFRTRLAP